MNNSMNEVVVVEAIRTPIGAYKGSLKELSADKLGSIVIREILRKSKLDKNDIDEVIKLFIMFSIFKIIIKFIICKMIISYKSSF